MTDETKAIIDGLKVFRYPTDIEWQSFTREFVQKSDVVELVEKLTRWTRVDSDIHPKAYTSILMKNERIIPPIYDTGYWTGYEYVTAISPTHWKPII